MKADVEKVLVTQTETLVVPTEVREAVVTQTDQREIIVTGIMGPPGTSKVSAMDDVDLSALTSGSILVYDTNSEKWVSKTLLNQQQVDCSEF